MIYLATDCLLNDNKLAHKSNQKLGNWVVIPMIFVFYNYTSGHILPGESFLYLAGLTVDKTDDCFSLLIPGIALSIL